MAESGSGTSYLEALLPLLEGLGHDPGIAQAGRVAAAAIGSGGKVWLPRTSHTLHSEGTYRAGGLMAVHALDDPLSVQPGDCVILGVPAGTSAWVVELAIETRRRGGVLVALTSVTFENDPRTVVEHVSGKRLHELADVVVDLAGPAGDGVLQVDGLPAFPPSGVTGVAALWMILAEAATCLVAEGKTPRVFQSDLVEGGRERNARELAEYRATGRGYRIENVTVTSSSV
jgi:uncharacterized phosphosugar-binding protein